MAIDWTHDGWILLGTMPSAILCALYRDLPAEDLPVFLHPKTFMIKLQKKEEGRIPFVMRCADQLSEAIGHPHFAARKPERHGRHVNVYRELDPISSDEDDNKLLLMAFSVPSPSQRRAMVVTVHPISRGEFEKRQKRGIIAWSRPA